MAQRQLLPLRNKFVCALLNWQFGSLARKNENSQEPSSKRTLSDRPLIRHIEMELSTNIRQLIASIHNLALRLLPFKNLFWLSEAVLSSIVDSQVSVEKGSQSTAGRQ